MNRKINILMIIISNIYPLIGLCFLDWNPYATVLVYLIETFIIVFFYLCKCIIRIIITKSTLKILPIQLIMNVIIFGLIHLVFATVLFSSIKYSSNISIESIINIFIGTLYILWTGIAIMFGRYFIYFIYFLKNKNYLKIPSKEYTEINKNHIFIRIFFMQIVVIFSGLIGAITGHISYGAVLLVLLQTIYAISANKKY